MNKNKKRNNKMAFSLNRIEIIGNIGGDAETRTTTNGNAATSFSVATTHSFKQNDEWKQQTTWHNCVAWNLGDYYRNALKKGAKVFVSGRLQKRSYEKDGKTYYITEIIVNEIIPLGKTETTTASNNAEPQYVPPADNSDLPF
ncbi:MAG: single-stranded DNA-binding protein [Bacteroidetes bacterium]|nr:MAG: single-stranded DNA-binding protein [Bacteroidota bacterium]